MLPEPAAGFTESLEKNIRQISAKVTIQSHFYITTLTKTGSVTIDSSHTYAQKVLLSENVVTRHVDIFLARESGGDSEIDVRILADIAGLPDTETVLTAGQIAGFQNRRPFWYRVQLQDTVELVSGTNYWVEVSCDGNTSVYWYLNSNVSSSAYCLNSITETSNQALILKILSTRDENNEYSLPNFQEYSLSLTEKFESDTGSFSISNLTGEYTEGQPLRHILIPGTEVKFHVGNGTTYLPKAVLIIDQVSQRVGKIVSVGVIGKQTKITSQDVVFLASFIGMDFSHVVYALLQQSPGIIGTSIFLDSGYFLDSGWNLDSGTGNITQTGVNFPATGTLEGTIAQSIQKICDATGFIFYYDNNGVATFEEKNTDYSPVFAISYNKHILFSEVSLSESKQDILNRIRIDNGQTSDGQSIDLNEAVSQGNFTGLLNSSTKSAFVTCSYDTAPVLSAYFFNNRTDETHLIERYRGVDIMIIEVVNLNYPDGSANYNFDVFGCTISNDDSDLYLQEVSNGITRDRDGIRDYAVTNNLFSSMISIKNYADLILLFNSTAREFYSVGTIGIPTIDNRDIVGINHPDIHEDFVFKVQGQEVSFRSEPHSFDISYKLERLPFLRGEEFSIDFFYLNSGVFLDSGKFLDSGLTTYQNLYV